MDGSRAHQKAASLEPLVVDGHGGGDCLGGCGVCDYGRLGTGPGGLSLISVGCELIDLGLAETVS